MADLFAGNRVSDLERAKDWYGRLLGSEPSFLPNEREAVWELAEHRFIYVELFEEGAGGALHTIIVDDFDERLAAIAERGIAPAETETYANGVRKAIYHDPDGNEIGFGGLPADG